MSRRRWRRTRRCCTTTSSPQGVEPKPTKPSNIAKMVALRQGRCRGRLRARPKSSIERRYTTKPVHQGYIEPHACVVSVGAGRPDARSGARARASSWSAPIPRASVGADIANIRAIPAEIGGGFGGKTIVYLEPLAYMLSKKSGRPVKIVMSREEVFRATGPTSGAVIEVKLGAKKDGRIVAAQSRAQIPGRRVSRARRSSRAASAGWRSTTCRTSLITGYDVVCNRPKVAAYRAPGAPIGSFGGRKLPRRAGPRARASIRWHCARSTARKDGTKAAHGPTWTNIGYHADARRGESARAVQSPARTQPGARRRLGLLAQCRRRIRALPCTSTRTARSR